MSKKIILFTVLSLFLLSACKKSSNNPSSTWYVDGQKFSTNDVYVDIGKMQTDFATHSFKNGFDFVFNPDFAGNTLLKLDCRAQNAPHVCFIIYYNDSSYTAKTDTPHYVKKVIIKSGLTQYTLDSTWLYNTLDTLNRDSIMVSGVFNEPYSD